MKPAALFALRSLVFSAAFAFSSAIAAAAASDPLRTALDAFSGEWEGEIRLHAIDGFLLRTIPVERRYSWDGEVQVVETRFVDEGATYEVRARQTVELGRLHAVVTRPGQPPEEYHGTLAEGGISWTNAERNKRDYRERILIADGQPLLEASSTEIVRLKVVSGLARVTLALRPKAGAPAVAGGAAPAAGTAAREDPALRERLGQVERELADALASSAARASELAALGARLTAVERERAAAVAAGSEAEAAAARLRDELAQARASAASGSQAGAVVMAERDALVARVRELERAVAEAAVPRADPTIALNTRIAGLEREQAAVWEARRAAESTAARLREELAAAQATAAQAAPALAALAGERDALAARLKELEQAAAEKDAAEPARAPAPPEVDTAGLVSAREAAEARVRELEAALVTLRQEQAKQSESMSIETRRLQGRLGEAEAARRRLDGRVSTLEVERDALQATLAKAGAAEGAELERVRGEASSAMRQAERLLVERDALAARLAEVAQREEELRAQAAESARAAKEAGEGGVALRRQLEQALASRDHAAAEAATLREQIAAAEVAARQVAGELGSAREQLATLEAAREAAVLRATELSGELAGAAANAETSAAENRRLAARVGELEEVVKQAEAVARERDALAARLGDHESSTLQLADLRAEREKLALRLVELENRAKTSELALERERAEGRTRLERSEAERLEAVGRAAELEQRLAAAAQTAVDSTASEAALADLRRQLALSQADTDVAMRQAQKILTERDLFAGRLADAERVMATVQASLDRSLAEASAAGERLAAAESRARELEASLAAATREHDLLMVRLSEQPRPPGGGSGEDGAAARAERERVLAEVGRLDRRVIELESERNNLRGSQALLQKQLQEATRLRDDTVARFEDVVSQLNAVREERDRLARANANLQAELRAARAASNTPSATSPLPAGKAPSASGPAPRLEDDPESTLLGRLRAAVQGGPTGQRNTNTPAAAPARTAESVVNGLVVTGVTSNAAGDKVILDGRLYRNGEEIDGPLGLVFVRVEGDALVFADRAGLEYRRRY